MAQKPQEPKPALVDPMIRNAMFMNPNGIRSGDAIRSMQQNAFQTNIGNPVFSPSLPNDFDSKALMEVIKFGGDRQGIANTADDVYAAGEHDEAMRFAVADGLISQSKMDERVKGRDIATTYWLEEVKRDKALKASTDKYKQDLELAELKGKSQDRDMNIDDPRKVGWKLAKNKIRKKFFGLPTSVDDAAKDALRVVGVSGKLLSGFGNLTDLTVTAGNAEIGGPAWRESQARMQAEEAARPEWEKGLSRSGTRGPLISSFIDRIAKDSTPLSNAEWISTQSNPELKKEYQTKAQATTKAINYDPKRRVPIA